MLKIHTSPIFLEEKAYVFQVLLGEILGIKFQMVPGVSETDYRICLPNGGTLKLENHFFQQDMVYIPPNPEAIAGFIPHPFDKDQTLVAIFGRDHFELADKRIHCGLDLVGDIYFMLSRWEEKSSLAFDDHGRFPASQSLAYKCGFLHRPVVNEWADLLYQMLQKLGWKQERPKRSYQLRLSCDVDHPRQWWTVFDRVKTLGAAIFKRRSMEEAAYLIQHQLFKQQDPFDIFDEWLDLFEQHKLVVQFNFMGLRPRNSDAWYPLGHPFVVSTIEKIVARGHEIGFHPSYEAFGDEQAFDRELASLQALVPAPIRSGRQHYLRFRVPDTWRHWQAAGLAEDCTLGYPEMPGFRCGICYDFPVFDFETRQVLALREQPLMAMDVSLAQYAGYTPEKALELLFELRGEVEKHGGDFNLLWHNSSWNSYYWKSWEKVLLALIEP